MTIDIIDFTETQYALLTKEQLLEVQQAQQKKNRLQHSLEEKLLKERNRLVNNGIYFSETYSYIEMKLIEDCEREIELIRDGLLFYLRYATRLDDDIISSPYMVDYSLDYQERYTLVRTYYEQAYTDKAKLFAAFQLDKVAPRYLGELYKPLYDYFKAA